MRNLESCSISLFLVFVFSACGGNSNEAGIGQGIVAQPQSCDIDSQKQFVFDVMHDTYLWFDQVPAVNLDDFETIGATLDALRAPLDRFSFINTVEANDNFFEEGTFEGFGFRAVINANQDEYLIGYVFDNSPSGAANWKRTDRIIAINGISSANIIAGNGLSAALSGLQVGDTAIFTIGTINSEPSDQILTKALVTMNTVLVSEVVQTSNRTVGYITLSSFIENTTDEFSAAIDSMNSGNIEELVLDLRYNGGGRVNASRNVASYIGGNNTNGFDFSKTLHNEKYTTSNSSNPFQEFSSALSLNRIYVLTTSSTCSASELVMNSLAPFVEVIQIGDTTCGKPVGMYGKEFCDQILLPIEFQSVNHNDQGDYFDGLLADCTASDDVTREFADPQEAMFSTALFHMDNSSCPTVSSATKINTEKANLIDEVWLPQKQVN